MIEKLHSDRFMELVRRHGLTIPELLGWKKSKLVYYPFITSKGFQDVRKVFRQTDEEDDKLLSNFRTVQRSWPLLTKARKVAEIVNERIRYEYDRNNWGQVEFWARPIETWEKGVDDCDGYAVLICKVLRLLGATEYEAYVGKGRVNHPAGQDAGMHAYVSVFDVPTFTFYPVEGSFYPDLTDRELRAKVPQMINTRYETPDWIVNDVAGYSTFPFFRFIR